MINTGNLAGEGQQVKASDLVSGGNGVKPANPELAKVKDGVVVTDNEKSDSADKKAETEDKSNTSDKTGTETAESTTEKVEASTTTTPATASGTVSFNTTSYVNVFDFILANQDKLVNVKVMSYDLSRVPTGKHLLFVTNEEADASIYKIDNPNNFFFKKTDVQKIIVEHTGLSIIGNESRVYIGKSNSVQFHLNSEGNVSSVQTFKKTKELSEKAINEKCSEFLDVPTDQIKLICKNITPKLFIIVKDLTDKKKIKIAILNFTESINDINYLIKINHELLLNYKY